MYDMFTASELSVKWDCSDKTARKACNREGLKEGSKNVSGKNVDAWEVPPEKIESLKLEIAENQKRASGNNKIEQEHSQPYKVHTDDVIDISPNHTESNNNEGKGNNLVFEMMRMYKDDIKEVSFTFLKELKEKDRQVLLLQDSERIKENEYLRQIAEFKTEIANITKQYEEKVELLQNQINLLQSENEKLKQKTFFGIKIK